MSAGCTYVPVAPVSDVASTGDVLLLLFGTLTALALPDVPIYGIAI
jgi:hypothetical protein